MEKLCKIAGVFQEWCISTISGKNHLWAS